MKKNLVSGIKELGTLGAAIAVITAFFGMVFFVIFISIILTYFLWNWLMPIIFGLPVITFWQAFGLNVLSSILFKNNNVKYGKD